MNDVSPAPRRPVAVLFVCTANRRRSPMAEGLLRRMLDEAGPAFAGWRVASAGTWADDGLPPVAPAVQAMRDMGVDISRHRSRILGRELLARFDVILVMERQHRDAIRAEFPECAARTHPLSALAGADFDVNDPAEDSLYEARMTARTLHGLLDGNLEALRALALTDPRGLEDPRGLADP